MKRDRKIAALMLAIGVIPLTVGILTGCGAGFEPEPTFEDECGGGTIISDSAFISMYDTGGDSSSATVTIRLCVDRGGSVIAVDLS